MSAEYAPELNVVGAVLGSPVGDPGNAFRAVEWLLGVRASHADGGLAGGDLPGTRPGAAPASHRQGKRRSNRGPSDDDGFGVLRLANRTWPTTSVGPLDQILDLPEIQYVFNDIRLGGSVPAPPVLMVQAVHDPIIAVDDIDALAEIYTAGGAAVTYHRDMLSGHALLHPMSAPMALRWLTDRFAGRPLTGHVVRTTWPTLLNPATYRGMARLTVIAAKVITGRSIGRPRLVSPVRGVRLHPAMKGRRTQTRGSSRATSSNSQHAVSLCADEVPNSVEDTTS